MAHAIPEDWQNPGAGVWRRLRWPAPKLSNGWLVKPGTQGATDALLASVGAAEIVDPGASPGVNEVVESTTLTDVNGTPTLAYTYRAKTQAELDAEAAAATSEAEREVARQAVTNLQAYIDAASPTNAQTVAVVRLLCRVCIRLIKDTFRSV